MKDTRTFWQKFYKLDPRNHDLTPKGKWILFLTRVCLSFLVLAIYITAISRNFGNSWWLFLLVLGVGMVIIDRVEQFVLDRFTYAAEKAKLDQKVAETLQKATQR